MRLSWPLIGRTEEMRILAAAISGSDVPGVVISGAEGVGKSRIAREALAVAASVPGRRRVSPTPLRWCGE